MNITLDLSKGQLSKLRNGHGIRISPAMVGNGVDIIVDPMTYHNMSKKLDRGKGVIIKMGSQEIDMNKMEGTGLFAGMGNKSGKISRTKKAGKWLGFTKEALNTGMDLGERGLSIYQKAREKASPIGQLKSLFGGELESEMEGGNLFQDAKKVYNKKVKNTAVGKAIRKTARKGLEKGYDLGTDTLDRSKYTKPIATIGRNTKDKNVEELMRLSGLGVFDTIQQGYKKHVKNTPVGKAVRDTARNGLSTGYDMGTSALDKSKFTKPIATIGRNSKQANVDRAMKMSGLGLRVAGDGLRMSGGTCCGCGMYNDKFVFSDQAL
jgi:hypothetical protein